MLISSSQPARITWTFDELVSSDAHALRCRFSASVRVADTDADRRMFAEVFQSNGRRDVTVEDVVAHFSAPLRAAALASAATGDADRWITGDQRSLQAALLDAARPVAFACGLELLPPFRVDVESPTLLRQKVEAVQRTRAEERAAGQLQHLQRATELLKQFQAMREQAPQLSAGRLLEQISAADRGLTLQSLLMASGHPSTQQPLWAVAGPQLLRIDPRTSPPRVEMFSLPTDAGPLRSVQDGELDGEHVLLLGARSGVMVVQPNGPDNASIYRDDTISSQLGFNRVVSRGGDEIWACHGEAGVVGWKANQPASPIARHAVVERDVAILPNRGLATSPSIAGSSGQRASRPSAPRNLQAIDSSRLIFSVGNEIHVLRDSIDETIASPSKSEIIAILSAGGAPLCVIHQDGTIATLDDGAGAIAGSQNRAAGVCAVGVLPWLDSARLLLASEAGPIDCVGLDDPLVTQYTSPHRGLRTVAAAADIVAAVSSDRQRLILWQSWDGRAPIAEIHITAQTRHRIADIEFC